MSDRVERLRAQDFDEAVAFMGMAFGFKPPRTFETLLPAIYKPTDESMRCNYAIRRDGRIVAVVGVFPRVWRVGSATLTVAGVGGVSAHPELRRQGFMTKLMTRAVADMKADGASISYLGGQRQRYGYFGYERCGVQLSFALRKTNLRHAGPADPPALTFEPLGVHYVDRVKACKALHERRAIHCVRPVEEFVTYALNWGAEPWVALDASGQVAGHVVFAREGGRVTEVDGADDRTKLDILRAWLARHDGESLVLSVEPDDVGFARVLGALCESLNVWQPGNWQVFDWPAVLGALLAVHHRNQPLAEGRVVADIGGSRVALWVKGAEAACETAEGEADVSMTALDAHRALFGPARPHEVFALPRRAALLEAWCPLPLGWTRPDAV